MRRTITIAAVMSIIVAACGGDPGADTTTTAAPTTVAETTTTQPGTTSTTEATTTTTTTPAEMGVVIYLFVADVGDEGSGPYLVPVYRTVPETEGVARAALTELIAGPTPDETAGLPALSSAVPADTRLLGVDIEGGVAVVDLSSEFEAGGGSAAMFGRLAQVVFTLTRFPTVDAVVFRLEGEPVEVFSSEGIVLDGPQTRDAYFDQLPAIFVDSPAWGEPVESPVEVRGLSNVFEATSQVMLTDDDGLALFEEPVTATCGTGCWGEWEVSIPYELDRDQFGALIVWNFSARDGSRENIREYPIFLR